MEAQNPHLDAGSKIGIVGARRGDNMAETNTEQKQNNDQSSALNDALTRSRIENTRSLYDYVIKRYREHLNKCNEPECLKCKDAKVLIPHYQDQMESDLRACEARK